MLKDIPLFMKKKMDEKVYTLDIAEPCYNIQIKRLCAVMLERAIADLVSKDDQIQFQAREWLTEWTNGMPKWISFKDVSDILQLSASRLNKIKRMLE